MNLVQHYKKKKAPENPAHHDSFQKEKKTRPIAIEIIYKV